MADSSDDILRSTAAARLAPPLEHVLWALRKGARTAEARVRPHAHGQQLRFLYDDELLWSEVFMPGRGIVLGEIAEAKRLEFLELGWRPMACSGRECGRKGWSRLSRSLP